MTLQGPMRNSGNILKCVQDRIIQGGGTMKSSIAYKVNEQCFPQGFEVSSYPSVYPTIKCKPGVEIQYFEQALQEMLTFRKSEDLTMSDMIVVLIPHCFQYHLDLFVKVAENLELSTSTYFEEAKELQKLKNFRGVFFTDHILFQGCEAKLVIAVINANRDDSPEDVNSMLRCVTKLINVYYYW